MRFSAAHGSPPRCCPLFSECAHQRLAAQTHRHGGGENESELLHLIQPVHERAQGEKHAQAQQARHAVGVEPHHGAQVHVHAPCGSPCGLAGLTLKINGGGFRWGMSGHHRAFGNIHGVRSTLHQSLVVSGKKNGMSVPSQLVEPTTEHVHRGLIEARIGFVQQHQGRCGAGEGRQEASQNCDLSGLALGEVRHHVVGTVSQVERLEKRLSIHRGTAHAHGALQMFDDHLTAQHAVLLQNGAHRERGGSSPSLSIDDHGRIVVHPPLFQW